jgi:thiazole synthase ThiGH ThiG subunit
MLMLAEMAQALKRAVIAGRGGYSCGTAYLRVCV